MNSWHWRCNCGASGKASGSDCKMAAIWLAMRHTEKGHSAEYWPSGDRRNGFVIPPRKTSRKRPA